MIKSLYLKNFKSFLESKITFKPLTVFSGLNCAGKSSIIEALKIIFDGYSRQSSEILTRDSEYDTLISFLTKERFFEIQCLWNDEIRPFKYEKDPHKSFDVITGPSLSPKDFRLVSAGRIGPQSTYNLSKFRNQYQWSSRGEDVFSFLFNAEEKGLYVEQSLQKANSHNFRDNVEAWLSIISPGTKLKVEYSSDLRRATPFYNNVSPIETGFGLSYTLPVIVSLLDPTPGTVVIENPEAHLHPKGQTEIGELIAKSISTNKQVIVETHSDRIIDGIRIAAALGDVNANDVSLMFVSKENLESESKVKEITVDRAGNLSEWPKDFFDQTLEDAKRLMKIKRR